MSTTNYHMLTTEETLTELKTSETGLSYSEAEIRFKNGHANEISTEKKVTILKMIYSHISDLMVLILLFAAVISLIMGERISAYVIFLIVAINTTIGVIQEKRASSSIEAIKSVNAPKARVIREDEESIIEAKQLVVGDLFVVEDGDVIPADARLLESANMMVNESNLTGESVSCEKYANVILESDCDLIERSNMIYSSSVVTYGRGVGIVTATGKDTVIGNIATELTKIDNFDTPIKRKLKKLAKGLSLFGLLVFIIVMFVGFLNGMEINLILMTAAALAVSVIPEGLPATSTIIMAMGVQRMAKKNALVRNLPSVETLGGATVICSDKTGTLTMNKMTVTKIAGFKDIMAKESSCSIDTAVKLKNICYEEIVLAGSLCNDAAIDSEDENKTIGDPTEGALINLAKTFGKDSDSLKENFPRVYEISFDSERKRMTTVHQMGAETISYTKGAVDKILNHCQYILTDNGVQPISNEIIEKIQDLTYSMASDALRVLAFAKKFLKNIPEYDSEDDKIEEELIFIGLVGMSDPPRKDVKKAIEICKNSGIRTVMITGDHKITAMAIAKNLGIWRAGDISLTGKDLTHLSDKELDKIVKKVTVFARVSPHDKLRIIESLKRKGEVVAMTGDGVNDVPALKAADIGCAMGEGGTDVAKDASDIVLTDNNFSTIVSAIEEGRKVYQNIQKNIIFLLAGCIGEILSLLIASVFNWGLPFLAIQVLWGNVITDTFPALALGMEPAERNIMELKPQKNGKILDIRMIVNMISVGTLMGIVTAFAYRIGSVETNHMAGQTMTLCVLSLSLLFYSFSLRSFSKPVFFRKVSKNDFFVWAIIFSLFFMGIILFVPALKDIFRVTSLTASQWGMVLVLGVIPTVFAELLKLFKKEA